MQHWTKKPLSLLVITAHLLPSTASANATPAAAQIEEAVVREVELGAGGVATGVVLNAEGQPAPNTAVEFYKDNNVIQAVTDQNGWLRVSGLTGGGCAIKAGETIYACRFWKNGTAPPDSLHKFAVIDQQAPVVRGQSQRAAFSMPDDCDYLPPYKKLSKRHLVLLGLVAAGVTAAIVVAAQDDDADASL